MSGRPAPALGAYHGYWLRGPWRAAVFRVTWNLLLLPSLDSLSPSAFLSKNGSCQSCCLLKRLFIYFSRRRSEHFLITSRPLHPLRGPREESATPHTHTQGWGLLGPGTTQCIPSPGRLPGSPLCAPANLHQALEVALATSGLHASMGPPRPLLSKAALHGVCLALSFRWGGEGLSGCAGGDPLTCQC